MSFIYFHTSTTERIEQALNEGTAIICSGGARDLPETRRGILWDACQGVREYEISLRKDGRNVTADSVVGGIDNDRETFLGEDAIEIEDFS